MSAPTSIIQGPRRILARAHLPKKPSTPGPYKEYYSKNLLHRDRDTWYQKKNAGEYDKATLVVSFWQMDDAKVLPEIEKIVMALDNNFGFDTVWIHKIPSGNHEHFFREMVDNMVFQATADDLIVYYYVGHGFVKEKKLYFAPTRIYTGVEIEWYRFEEQLAQCPAKVALLIEACFSGTSIPRHMVDSDTSGTTERISASGKNELASTPCQGSFARELPNIINNVVRDRKDKITFFDLGKLLKKHNTQMMKKNPNLLGTPLYNLVYGDPSEFSINLPLRIEGCEPLTEGNVSKGWKEFFTSEPPAPTFPNFPPPISPPLTVSPGPFSQQEATSTTLVPR